jgi:hypothetical protein
MFRIFPRNYKEVDKLMKETYVDRKQDAQCRPIKEVLSNWPFLCEQQYITMDFHLLHKFDVIATYEQNLSLKGAVIFEFLEGKLFSKDPQSFNEIHNHCAEWATERPKFDGIIGLLMSYFRKENQLVILHDVSCFAVC